MPQLSHVTLLKDNLVARWLSSAQMDALNIGQQKAQKQRMKAEEGRVPSDANGQKSVKMSEPLVNSLAKWTLIRIKLNATSSLRSANAHNFPFS